MFVEVNNLTKSFKELKAVNKINFNINKGDIFGLLGPNGAGKSTTISILSTLLKPDEGEIFISGIDVVKESLKVKKLFGLIPQEIALYSNMTAKENLMFWGSMYKIPRSRLKNRVDEVLKLTGLEDRCNERIDKYSGGMKRRINIGAALIHNPELLIMDEPTVGIDPQSRNHILETVKKLSKDGMTIIYTSHYMEEVEYLCNEIAIMDEGKILAKGNKNQLKEMVDNLDIVNIRFKGNIQNISSTLLQIQNVEQVNTNNDTITLSIKNSNENLVAIIDALTKIGIVIISIDTKEANLESVFLKLTGKTLRD